MMQVDWIVGTIAVVLSAGYLLAAYRVYSRRERNRCVSSLESEVRVWAPEVYATVGPEWFEQLRRRGP